MNKYELLYIIDRDVTEEARENAMKLVEDTIAEFGGNVTNVDKWGMRKFAYPINYKTEGYYVLVAFEADPSSIKEMERRMRVNDAFVRYMTTSVIENKKTEAAKTAKRPARAQRAERVEKVEKPEEKVEEVVVEEVVTEEVPAAAEETTENA